MNEFLIFLAVVIIIIPAYIYLNHLGQSPDDNKSDIEKALKKKGLKLIEIKVPKLFDTGPFPKIEFSIGPQTQVLGVRGEKSRYRIVKFENKKGMINEAWVKIEITAFVVVRMRWSPELK